MDMKGKIYEDFVKVITESTFFSRIHVEKQPDKSVHYACCLTVTVC